MCRILISINPKYVKKILTGQKKYEYRKIKTKRKNVNTMVIYSTYPIMKVVAEVDIEDIIEESPENLWEITKDFSGITKEFYNNYYKDKESAIAYKLGNIKIYDKPKDLVDIGINFAPQSFIYID